ncbi:uncharacterized protein LOC123274728 [Cotesia glomerata]|uniref:MADF domain-containing protein n=1 Tax=Cotesia glomerata TaxID=32391 RepID=A0AAV7J5H5_COTGL|nr:uncharacterized protein LOC123274728 [Cotesia glomerata]KAH0566977.1 hypothetical protein KQX54_005849 [Cotesia glomerata]
MAPSGYNTAVTKKFIAQVQKNKCLYDLNVKKNFNNKGLDSIWLEIVNKCHLESVTKARRKWGYLAAQYKKGLVNPLKKSIYHDDLNFLYSFVQTIEDVEDDEVEFIMKKESEDAQNRPRMRENSYERPMSSASGRNSLRRLSNENRSSTSSGRQSVFSMSGYPSMSVGGPSEAMQIDNPEDELKPLFESWYRSTKKLPPEWQRHVKRQFSEIINVTEANVSNEIAE